MKKLTISFLSGIGALLLSACSGPNPLMNDNVINDMKAKFFLDDDDFPIQVCSKYYVGNGDSKFKKKCDSWTEHYFKSLYNNGALPSKATLNDFRDSTFWRAVSKRA